MVGRKTTASKPASSAAKRTSLKRECVTKDTYNETIIADKVFRPPAPKKAPKKKVAKKNEKKISTPYRTLIKRGLKKLVKKDNHSGVSIIAILKWLSKNYPGKAERRFVRLALAKGVANKVFVQTRQRFRLSSKEANKKSATKKSTKKATTTKKASSKPKKATTKKTTTKKTATKKTAAKKSTTKKAEAPKKKATKSTKERPSKKAKTSKGTESSKGTIAEGEKGVWQYYDNGWHDYVPEASDIVEKIYQEYKANPDSGMDVRAVKSGHFIYSVDFTGLTQRNTETHTVRNIQRRVA